VARLLVVDDDPRVRRFVRDVLAEAGHDVTDVGDAESAVEKLLSARPEVFVLDIHLPGMDGLALARKLRRVRRGVPVVIISAKNDVQHKVSAHASGAITYLEKPFRPEDLRDAVSLALGLKSRREI
jgi:DNA-binding response OmpR family regulator